MRIRTYGGVRGVGVLPAYSIFLFPVIHKSGRADYSSEIVGFFSCVMLPGLLSECLYLQPPWRF